jgi:hypothetical protein
MSPVWLAEDKEKHDHQSGIGKSSIVHETIEVLREIGLLDAILPTKEGLVVYPADVDAER